MTTDRLIKSSKRIALLSMITGSLIFLMFLASSGIESGVFGLFFIAIAALINLIYLILLIIRIFHDNGQKLLMIKTMGLILLNIPILFVYCWFAIIWINTLRITFVNESSSDLKNIEVVGCENRIIYKLDKNKSKTIWLRIPHDCGVSINYNINGIEKTEDVTGYVTNENGYSMTFKIGTNQKPYDQDL